MNSSLSFFRSFSAILLLALSFSCLPIPFPYTGPRCTHSELKYCIISPDGNQVIAGNLNIEVQAVKQLLEYRNSINLDNWISANFIDNYYPYKEKLGDSWKFFLPNENAKYIIGTDYVSITSSSGFFVDSYAVYYIIKKNSLDKTIWKTKTQYPFLQYIYPYHADDMILFIAGQSPSWIHIVDSKSGRLLLNWPLPLEFKYNSFQRADLIPIYKDGYVLIQCNQSQNNKNSEILILELPKNLTQQP